METHKRLENHSMIFRTENERSSMRHIEVNAVFRQRELGISAGLPSLSCLPTQKTNAGASARERLSRAIFGGSRRLETLAVVDLVLLSVCEE